MKGTPNKKTMKLLFAQAVDEQASNQGRKKLAKDVLDDFMNLFAGMAAYYQPRPPTQTPNPNENEGKFIQCAELVRDFATALAKYQSPQFKAIAMYPTAPPQEPRAPADPASNVIELHDADALTRLYRRTVAQVG